MLKMQFLFIYAMEYLKKKKTTKQYELKENDLRTISDISVFLTILSQMVEKLLKVENPFLLLLIGINKCFEYRFFL